MSIIEKLDYLNETKELIKDAIESQGQTISNEDTFRSYATKIANISGGGVSGNNLIVLTENDETEINENGTLNGTVVQDGTKFVNSTNNIVVFNNDILEKVSYNKDEIDEVLGDIEPALGLIIGSYETTLINIIGE